MKAHFKIFAMEAFVHVEARIVGRSERSDEAHLAIFLGAETYNGAPEEINGVVGDVFDGEFHVFMAPDILFEPGIFHLRKIPSISRRASNSWRIAHDPSFHFSRGTGNPSLHEPESCVLPVYYAPMLFSVIPSGVERSSLVPHRVIAGDSSTSFFVASVGMTEEYFLVLIRQLVANYFLPLCSLLHPVFCLTFRSSVSRFSSIVSLARLRSWSIFSFQSVCARSRVRLGCF